MKKNPFLATLALPVTLLLMLSACTKETPAPKAEQEDNVQFTSLSKQTSSHKLNEALSDVRSATARFHSTNQAIKNGYQPSDHCVSAPGLGVMGYHWANPALVDDVYDPLQPEVLLYAKDANGNIKLVGVEYIVLNVGQPRPMLGTQPFDIGGTPMPMPHWSLHVWLYEHNPSGMFAPFNPNLSCN
jgi:hypothetical protein